MAEKETNTNKIILSSAYEYTKLYRYVFAFMELKSRSGKYYERAKEIIPDIDDKLKKGTVKAYNEVIFAAKGVFPGLEGMSMKDLHKLAVYASSINQNKTFPPTLDQVDECKQEYDKRLEGDYKKTADELQSLKEKRNHAKKNLRQSRGKLAGSILLGILAVGGLAALGVGFAAGIVSVVSSAIAGSVAGIASGFAIGGVILGVVGAKLIFNGITKVFKNVINNIKKHNQVKNQSKEQYKRLDKSYNEKLTRMRQLDNQIYLDRASQSDDLSKYPGAVPEPDYLKIKEKVKEKVKDLEDEIDNMQVTNQPLTEKERQAQLNEYLKDRDKKYAEFENDYGDEEKRKELDPENPKDKEILNYFEEKQKFYKEFDQSIFPMNPISTSTPTTAQINSRYSSDVQKVVDEQFREYMKGVDMHSQTGGEFDSEKLRKECLEKAEENVKKAVEQNIKEFESNYEDKGYDVPDNVSSDLKKLIATDKVIETIENAKETGADLDDEVVKEQLKQLDNENVVPEVVARGVNPEEIIVETENNKGAKENTKRGSDNVGVGTKDAEIDPNYASLDMRSPEDRLVLYRLVLGLMEEFENPETSEERRAELQAQINKYKEKYVVLKRAKDSKGLRELIAADESKLGSDSGKGKEVKPENEGPKVPYEQAVEAIKGFNELAAIAGAKDKESSQLKFALKDSTGKEIIAIEKKGNEYVLINQNGTLDSKDINSIEDVKKFVSETIEKAKEVKAENKEPKKEEPKKAEPKVVEVNIDRRKVMHQTFLQCFDNDEEAAKEFIASLPKEKQAELIALLDAKRSKDNSAKVVKFVNENRKEAAKEEKVEVENNLLLDPSKNKAYAEMISYFGGPENFTKIAERLSDEEVNELVEIMNDPEVLENPKSPKVEKAYDILRKHKLDMEKDEPKKEKVVELLVVKAGTNSKYVEYDIAVKADEKVRGTEKGMRIHDKIKAEIENIGLANAYKDPEKAKEIIVNILNAEGCELEGLKVFEHNVAKELEEKAPEAEESAEEKQEQAVYQPYIFSKLGNDQELYNEFIEANKGVPFATLSKEQLDATINEFIKEKVEKAKAEAAKPKPTKTQKAAQKVIDDKLAKLREKGIEVDVESMTEEDLKEFRRDMQSYTHEQLKKLLPEKYKKYMKAQEDEPGQE